MKKITVSGIVIMDNKQQKFVVEIKTPDIPTNYLNGYILNRYLPEALETKLKEPFKSIRSFEIEKIENLKEESSFYDKSIFELTKKELRDFCCEFLFTGINISKNLNDLQNLVALEFLKEIKHLNVYEISGFSSITKQGAKIVNFEVMRSEESKFLFIIKKSQKPNPKLKSEEEGKISLEYLKRQESETNIKQEETNSKDSEEELYGELIK